MIITNYLITEWINDNHNYMNNSHNNNNNNSHIDSASQKYDIDLNWTEQPCVFLLIKNKKKVLRT